MNIVIAGQKRFGSAVLGMIAPASDDQVLAVSAPPGDRLRSEAERLGIPVVYPLTADNVPDGCDLIVCAHAHEFISEKARLRARFGAIGYHPSLLPLHRGRDAIRWALHMGDKVTGGTVYRLDNGVDTGPVINQAHVLIPPGITAADLWHDILFPQALSLMADALLMLKADPMYGHPQCDAMATREPAFDVTPIHRPDLVLLNYDGNRG